MVRAPGQQGRTAASPPEDRPGSMDHRMVERQAQARAPAAAPGRGSQREARQPSRTARLFAVPQREDATAANWKRPALSRRSSTSSQGCGWLPPRPLDHSQSPLGLVIEPHRNRPRPARAYRDLSYATHRTAGRRRTLERRRTARIRRSARMAAAGTDWHEGADRSTSGRREMHQRSLRCPVRGRRAPY